MPELHGPQLVDLLAIAPLNELGPGRPNLPARAILPTLTPERLLAPHALADRRMAQAALAGLWLRHDFFAESHAISQDLETPEGSYWHGILHRREPDYGNARYWMRRVGAHPIHKPLLAYAESLEGGAGSTIEATLGQRSRARSDAWNAAEFVQLCETAARAPVAKQLLVRQIQLREWELLFEYCFRAATGLVPPFGRESDVPRSPDI